MSSIASPTFPTAPINFSSTFAVVIPAARAVCPALLFCARSKLTMLLAMVAHSQKRLGAIHDGRPASPTPVCYADSILGRRQSRPHAVVSARQRRRVPLSNESSTNRSSPFALIGVKVCSRKQDSSGGAHCSPKYRRLSAAFTLHTSLCKPNTSRTKPPPVLSPPTRSSSTTPTRATSPCSGTRSTALYASPSTPTSSPSTGWSSNPSPQANPTKSSALQPLHPRRDHLREGESCVEVPDRQLVLLVKGRRTNEDISAFKSKGPTLPYCPPECRSRWIWDEAQNKVTVQDPPRLRVVGHTGHCSRREGAAFWNAAFDPLGLPDLQCQPLAQLSL